jgi:hypothetical protein
MSKKEMKALLFKRDSLIQHHENQISIYRDLTTDLNNKILLKKDSIVSYAVRINQLISEKHNLEQEKNKLKKENTDFNIEIKENNRKFNILDSGLTVCKLQFELLSASRDSLFHTLSRTELKLDSLTKSNSVVLSLQTANSNDILNKMYFDNEYPKELHARLEFSAVLITSLNGGGNSENSDVTFNLDGYISASQNKTDSEWTPDYYMNQNGVYYDYDYRNPKWQVFFASDFVPASELKLTDMEGNLNQLDFKFDLIDEDILSLSNVNLEKNKYICNVKPMFFFGKQVLDWKLAHSEAGKMKDLFFRTFEMNGQAYIALNNFQLLNLKSGFAPMHIDYNGQSEYYTFDDLPGNNKILSRLKSINSEASVLDPA